MLITAECAKTLGNHIEHPFQKKNRRHNGCRSLLNLHTPAGVALAVQGLPVELGQAAVLVPSQRIKISSLSRC